MALHNFIHDSKLHDKEFDRRNADEDYLLEETSESQEESCPDGENEDTMNTIHSRIANDLVSARE